MDEDYLGGMLEQLLGLTQGCFSAEFVFQEGSGYISLGDVLSDDIKEGGFGFYPWDAVSEGQRAIPIDDMKDIIERITQICGNYLHSFIQFVEVTDLRHGRIRGSTLVELGVAGCKIVFIGAATGELNKIEEGGGAPVSENEPYREFLMFVDLRDLTAFEKALRQAVIFEQASQLVKTDGMDAVLDVINMVGGDLPNQPLKQSLLLD